MSADGRSSPTYDFSGRVVVITGGGRGQGRSHALAFARAGADVVIADIGTNLATVPYELTSIEALNDTAEEVRAHDVRCLPVVCDVRDGAQVRAMIADAVAQLGRIDILVNNAGVQSLPTVADMTEDQWDHMIDTVLKGTFHCSKFASEHMIRQRYGRIITTGSVCSLVGLPRQAHYCAAKHGILGFSRALALELAPYDITVNVVCPGGVNTRMITGLLESSGGEWLGQLPALTGAWNIFDPDAMLDPEEITNAVLWLASDATRFITGVPLPVDAGLTIK